jgi:nicotinate-nucleotide pyrophosphorylase (carboxylating)
VSGSARALLTGERTALNLLQLLSATATVARKYADAVADLYPQVFPMPKAFPGVNV